MGPAPAHHLPVLLAVVSHCFLSVFEIVVDVLFLCFAIDTKYNDGTPGREFYMDKALMVSYAKIWCTGGI